MKGPILAGGTRLRLIVLTSAEKLVSVADQPALVYGNADMAVVGITESGDDSPAEQRQGLGGDGSRWGVEVTTSPRTSPWGWPTCVPVVREFPGDDGFVICPRRQQAPAGLRRAIVGRASGPSSSAPCWESWITEARARVEASTAGVPDQVPSAQILVTSVPNPYRFGVAELDEQTT